MSKVHISLLTNTALNFMKKNIDEVTKLIQENDDNSWIKEKFPQPMFYKKQYEINDFELIDNPDSLSKEKDLENSVRLYEALKILPRYILTDVRFWLWLHLDKFYLITKRMMTINSSSTIKDHWLDFNGTRRSMMFGVLSRCFFRVELTILDEKSTDKYELTKWVIDSPSRFREHTWRSYSSETHLMRGIIKGEKKAYDETKNSKNIYPSVAKYILRLGSAKLLDAFTEEEIECATYNYAMKLYNSDQC